ncbi:MAG TPA: sigma-70 family RNA polymerase sigma factor [Actinomycetota bacterium]|nr:sigma-70 family RNA polymerase sigma factor [Actinomycetota bacterium]
MSDADEQALLDRARAGDPAAFDEVVDLYERRVFAVAMRIVRNHEDARDVTQEVFVTALRALKGFRGDAQLSTWFHRVAVNASLDLVRKRKRREHSSVDDLSDQPSAAPGPEAEAIASVRAREVHRALGALPPEQRALIVMHDLQDLDYAECAEVLGIPLGTVKSRLHRARLALARELGHLREAEPSGGLGPLR